MLSFLAGVATAALLVVARGVWQKQHRRRIVLGRLAADDPRLW
jgi:hypothetical protein